MITTSESTGSLTQDNGRRRRSSLAELLESKSTTVEQVLINKHKHIDIKSVIAAKVLNVFTPLSALFDNIDDEQHIEPVYWNTADGLGVYRQSLCFVLAMACNEVLPEKKAIRVEHGFGLESSSLARAYFCQFEDKAELTDEQVHNIIQTMNNIIAQDLSIVEQVHSTQKAVKILQSLNQQYAVDYLQSRSFSLTRLLSCGSYAVLSHSERGRVLAPRTGILNIFDLKKHANGLALHFPVITHDTPTPHIETLSSSSMILQNYEETNAWASVLELESLGDLNKTISEGKARDLIRVCDALQEKRIVDIARMIGNQRGKVRLVLIGGPSSSGKTTFAHKLVTQLTVFGFKPTVFSTDDYYRPRTDLDYPRDEKGELDHEDINALDMQLMNEHLLTLLNGGEIESPIFDFITGTRKPKGRPVKVDAGSNSIVVSEGIFCLHQNIANALSTDSKFKIFISPMSQLNLDESHYVSNQLLRLVRRITRDNRNRGRGALATIRKWPAVRHGEERNIFPHIHLADAVFNSALDYELPVLKVYVQPLLECVKPIDEEYSVASQLSGLLHMFHPIPADLLPSTSLIREFIGGSDYE